MAGRKIRFAIVGLDHRHVYNHTRLLLNAGAEFAAYYSDKPELIAEYAAAYPGIRAAGSLAEVLEDPAIDLIAGSPMPARRAEISVLAMRHGKDVVVDKPAVVSFDELERVQQVQRETGRIWCLYSNEHHGRRCTVLAERLVAEGAIGSVVQTTGFGPHSISLAPRPAWFWDRTVSGGIIADLGAHQFEQFLFFTGSRTASIVHAQTGNFAHPGHPEFEDYGEVSVTGDGGIGWFRVDWYSPGALGAPGDIRLFLLGTDGYMEMRKYFDAGRPAGERLLVVDRHGPRLMETEDVRLTFGERLLDDVRNRTETAIPQDRSFLVTRLGLEAQRIARRLDARDFTGGGPQGR